MIQLSFRPLLLLPLVFGVAIGYAADSRAPARGVRGVPEEYHIGAGDILEIQPAQGGVTVMLPFDKATVPTVDIAGRRIVIVPPEETE